MGPVGYKGPLRAILLVANFDAVAAVQHLLGLAMAVVIYLLLLRRGVSRWLAALAIAPVLLDAYQLQQEQAVMPGTWFAALIVAGLAILLWQPRTSWRAAVAGGIVLGTSATFRQAGEALRLAAGRRQGRRPVRRLRPAHPGLLHRVLPAHRGLLPVALGRHLLLRADGGRRGLRHHQAAARRAGNVPVPGAAGPRARLARV